MTIAQAQRYLQAFFWSLIIFSGIACLAYEMEWVTYAPIGENPQLTFATQMMMQLVTIVCVPVALRLFKWKVISRKLHANPGALRSWGSLRLGLICVPMLINTLLYEQTQLASFGYLSIISLLCLFFIYPSLERCRADIGEETTGEKE